ncbi:MAG: DUF3846 domain-containing protein [Ruminococcaceae bacterium]|nr:DUF3846 domain-containing protein [Oscillospiraceae bacterium]
MKEKTIRVLMVEPKKLPEACELENNLDALQKAISIGADYQGLIEIINLNEDTCILCNEEGKLIGLEPNRRLGKDILCGVFYVIGQDKEGNLTSLNKDAMRFYSEYFKNIEHINSEEIGNCVDVFFEIL